LVIITLGYFPALRKRKKEKRRLFPAVEEHKLSCSTQNPELFFMLKLNQTAAKLKKVVSSIVNSGKATTIFDSNLNSCPHLQQYYSNDFHQLPLPAI